MSFFKETGKTAGAAGAGAGAGAGAFALIGKVGVVACGTGVGIGLAPFVIGGAALSTAGYGCCELPSDGVPPITWFS